MKTFNYVVPEGIINNLKDWMGRRDYFSAKELEEEAKKQGVPQDGVVDRLSCNGTPWTKPVAMRVVDRLLQKERRKGKIEIIKGRRWRAVRG